VADRPKHAEVLSQSGKRPSETGGQTPLADTRKILKRLVADLLRSFEEHGVLYQRNFNSGLGLTWQKTFRTNQRDVLEHYCQHNQIDFTWRTDNALRRAPLTRVGSVTRQPVDCGLRDRSPGSVIRGRTQCSEPATLIECIDGGVDDLVVGPRQIDIVK